MGSSSTALTLGGYEAVFWCRWAFRLCKIADTGITFELP